VHRAIEISVSVRQTKANETTNQQIDHNDAKLTTLHDQMKNPPISIENVKRIISDSDN